MARNTQILNSTRFYVSSVHRGTIHFALLRHLLVSLLACREVPVQQSASLQVRVNGILINQVRLRGIKSDPRLVIVDPVVGAFEIDDCDNRFHVEMLDLNLPTEVRAALPNGGYTRARRSALIPFQNSHGREAKSVTYLRRNLPKRVRPFTAHRY